MLIGNSLAYDAILLSLAWLLYFLIHSILASLTVKRWVSEHYPNLMPSYRLAFNVIAIFMLSLPLYISSVGLSIPLWHFTGLWQLLMQGITLLAMVGFAWSIMYYDMLEFLGVRQIREMEKRIEDQEHLQISPFHRFVRHPWYTFALMLIWSRPMNSLVLTSSILLSTYFIIGSRLEDKKLLHYYGEAYARYRDSVPGLIPLPWKHLGKTEAKEITRSANQEIT